MPADMLFPVRLPRGCISTMVQKRTFFSYSPADIQFLFRLQPIGRTLPEAVLAPFRRVRISETLCDCVCWDAKLFAKLPPWILRNQRENVLKCTCFVRQAAGGIQRPRVHPGH